MSDPLADTLRAAQQVAREAGKVLLEGWGTRPTVGFKSEDINLVTEYDKRSEALIVERLIGYPAPIGRVLGHPVRWVGALIAWLEARLNGGERRRGTPPVYQQNNPGRYPGSRI